MTMVVSLFTTYLIIGYLGSSSAIDSLLPSLYPGHLIGFFPFDVSSEDYSPSGDVNGFGHHGQNSGAVLSNVGHEKFAYYFDGTAFVDIPLDINPSVHPKLSFGGWVNVAELPVAGSTNAADVTR